MKCVPLPDKKQNDSVYHPFIVKKTPVSMAKILRRINENDVACKAPKSLPVRDIIMNEWWISK